MERYTAHPVHIYSMGLPLLLLGAVAIAWGDGVWLWFGIICILFGIGIGLWIVATGILQSKSEWLSEQAYHSGVVAKNAQLMDRVKNPDVWSALGYVMPVPEQITVVEKELPTSSSYPKLSYPTPPASRPQMELLSNAVLRGDTMSYNRWGGKGKPFTDPKFRELIAWMEHPSRKYIHFINPSYPKLGRVPTRRGTEFFLIYGDLEVQKLFEQKGHTIPNGRLDKGQMALGD